MTIQAPAHAELLMLIDLLHLIDTTMTRHTTDPTCHMGAVVEVHVVRQVVDLDPLDRYVVRCALSNGKQLVALRMHESVAVHARRGRRNSRVARLVYRVVTIPTVDTHLARMQRMAVRNGLFWLVADISRLGRKAVPNKGRQINRSTAKSDARDLPGLIGPAREDEQLHRRNLSRTPRHLVSRGTVPQRTFRAEFDPAWAEPLRPPVEPLRGVTRLRPVYGAPGAKCKLYRSPCLYLYEINEINLIPSSEIQRRGEYPRAFFHPTQGNGETKPKKTSLLT